jgi:hypothetical protein
MMKITSSFKLSILLVFLRICIALSLNLYIRGSESVVFC